MNPESTFDSLPVLLVLGASVILMVLSFEGGAFLGTAHKKKLVKEQLSQVRSLMGAGLGMLAFMLGFSFNIAQSHFEKRNEAYLVEINAINSAYLTSGLLEDQTKSSRKLLRDFVEERVKIEEAAVEGRMDDAMDGIQDGEKILEDLWEKAENLQAEFGSSATGGFAQSILTMIDANESRKHAALYNRIPPVIWIGLFFVTALAMLVMGYHAGLTGARSRVATWTLALSFSLVLMLVADLDRPKMSLFSVNHQQMLDLQESMDE